MHQGAERAHPGNGPVRGLAVGPLAGPAGGAAAGGRTAAGAFTDGEPTMYGGLALGATGPAAGSAGRPADPAAILAAVYEALEERGYDPVRQLAGYLLSGDPAYITSHRGARALVARVERDELLAELVRSYVMGLRAREARREA